MTVTINEYNTTTGCVHFTIFGGPAVSTPGILTGAAIQSSTDGGATWVDSSGAFVSPRCGYSFAPTTLLRVKLLPNNELSNVINADNQLIRTVIDSPAKISLANSPVHFKVQNNAQDTNIKSMVAKLWIWSGAQNQNLGLPNVTYQKSKVSADDDYISIEISDPLKSYIERPNSVTNSNQPGFGYNVNDLPAVSGMGVFWQIQTIVTNNDDTVEVINHPTHFATLGYRWNYEQNGVSSDVLRYGSLGFQKPVVKWYNPNVPKYFNQDFVYGQPVTSCSTTSMVSTVVEAKTRTRCTRDSALLVYLDKRGLWDVFTVHGKSVPTTKVNSAVSKRLFRNPSQVNNSVSHSAIKKINDIKQSYTINTGKIDESDVQRVEELIYSPKVYLIRFIGDIVYQISEGTTIDSTFVTVDDTNITIDNTPIVPTMVPYFETFQQIPVVITDEDFTRKTLNNDRGEIDYNLKVEETNSKINDIR